MDYTLVSRHDFSGTEFLLFILGFLLIFTGTTDCDFMPNPRSDFPRHCYFVFSLLAVRDSLNKSSFYFC